ncbi:hypothetical protein CBM2586_B130542 [Cupriavidus phytorum]|uniref:Uncharacterized protein n=1 Tax=Cupriavidus taiwanensis TaxID=164546 RepID=A0A976AAJ2_9BURK|nr:hypothetical protein CBM2586_B130542 [Cupriavidus taiwanensis]
MDVHMDRFAVGQPGRTVRMQAIPARYTSSKLSVAAGAGDWSPRPHNRSARGCVHHGNPTA